MSAQSGVTKNRVEAVPHAGFMLQFIDHIEVVENTDDGHKTAEAVSFNGAVNLTGVISNADSHPVAAQVALGIIFKGGEYFAVVGERAYALDDLRVHGVLDGFDVAELKYVLKYLRRALTASVPA